MDHALSRSQDGVRGATPASNNSRFGFAWSLDHRRYLHIVIFTTGVIVDLFASSYMRTWEAAFFRSFAHKNACWMKPLLAERLDYIQDDWDLVLESSMLADFKSGFKAYVFWNKNARHQYSQAFSRSWRSRTAFTRVQSFLLAYVLLMSNSSQTEILSTQMSLWSIARALTGASVVIYLEAVVILFQSKTLIIFFLLFLILGFGAAYSAQSRWCSTLFALVYVTNLKSATTRVVPPTTS